MMKTAVNVNSRLHIAVFCLLLTVALLAWSPITASAKENSEIAIDGRVGEIIDDFRGTIPDGTLAKDDLSGINESLGIKRILSDIIGTLTDSSDELVSLLMCMLGMTFISSLASLFESDTASVAVRAVGLLGSSLLLERLLFLVGESRDSLGEINRFFGAVVPVVLAVNSLGAAPSTASTQALGMGITLSAYSFVAEQLLVGIVGAVFLCAALSSLDPMLSRLAKGIKNLFLSLLGASSMLIGATFALQSTIASSADSIAIRSARYAVSGAIPIVGNAVSGALGLVAGGISYARGIVGGGAIAVILSLVLSPLVTLLAYRLTVKAGVELCAWCSVEGCGGVFSSFLGALDSLIAVYSLTAVVYVCELVAFLRGGVSIA